VREAGASWTNFETHQGKQAPHPKPETHDADVASTRDDAK